MGNRLNETHISELAGQKVTVKSIMYDSSSIDSIMFELDDGRKFYLHPEKGTASSEAWMQAHWIEDIESRWL